MNYNDMQNAKTCAPCDGVNAQSIPEPLTGMMEQANNIAGKILTQVNRVKACVDDRSDSQARVYAEIFAKLRALPMPYYYPGGVAAV